MTTEPKTTVTNTKTGESVELQGTTPVSIIAEQYSDLEIKTSPRVSASGTIEITTRAAGRPTVPLENKSISKMVNLKFKIWQAIDRLGLGRSKYIAGLVNADLDKRNGSGS